MLSFNLNTKLSVCNTIPGILFVFKIAGYFDAWYGGIFNLNAIV